MSLLRSVQVFGVAVLSAGVAGTVHAQPTRYEIVHTFTGPPTFPTAGLLQASDGALYGTTSLGGEGARGTLFRYDLVTSAYTTVHTFRGPDGDSPRAALIQGADGALYGTTATGGASDSGTLFRYDLATSTLTTLHSFSGPDGALLLSGLVQGVDGALYGTTDTDVFITGEGTLFRFDLSNSTLTTLHVFNRTDGATPHDRPIQGADGALYGVTPFGGAGGKGTVFRYDLSTPRSRPCTPSMARMAPIRRPSSSRALTARCMAQLPAGARAQGARCSAMT